MSMTMAGGTWHSVRTVLSGTWQAGPWTFMAQGPGCLYPGFYRADGVCIPYHAVVIASRTEPKT